MSIFHTESVELEIPAGFKSQHGLCIRICKITFEINVNAEIIEEQIKTAISKSDILFTVNKFTKFCANIGKCNGPHL
jgi:regulator of RNase E activity RraB